MKRKPSGRMRKVDELLREVVAEEVALLKDPRIGFVTITGVETSPDLRSARVFYSVLGDQQQREDTQEGLDHAAPRIQSRLGHQVRLKYVPRLRFVVDESVERGMRITALLRNLEADGEGETDG